MTNDERHIAVLNRMLENMDVYDSIQPTTERKKAIKAAIKALEQQPCDDAVSREAVIEILENYGCTNREGLIFKDIRALPPVTQKPKYWIDKDNKIYKMPDDIPTMTIQYPTITHEDTISRTEVMNVISDFVTFEKYIDKHNHITFEPLEQMINSLPPVTQKYGKWIEHTEIETSAPEYLMFYECSECGNKPCFCKSDIHKKRFCSNCGARMVEPQESEEQTDAT